MLETIGIVTLVFGGIAVVFFLITRPSKQEKEEQYRKDRERITNINERELKESFIRQYSNFAIELFQEYSEIDENQLIEKIIARHRCTNREANDIFHKMYSSGLLVSWNQDKRYTKGLAFDKISNIYQNFTDYLERMEQYDFKVYNYFSNNPHIEKDIRTSLRVDIQNPIIHADLRFGITTINEAKESYPNLSIFGSGNSLYMIVMFRWVSEFLQFQGLKTFFDRNGLDINNPPQYIYVDTIPVVFDKSELEYKELFNRMYSKLTNLPLSSLLFRKYEDYN